MTKNPLLGNQDAIRDGGTKFRSRCAGCHGPDARGYIGPDITGLSAAGYTDERLFGIVRRGVPGTEMTPTDPLRVSDKEIWQMLAYLGTLTAAPSTPPSGDAQNGERDLPRQLQQLSHGQRPRRATGPGPVADRIGPVAARHS